MTDVDDHYLEQLEEAEKYFSLFSLTMAALLLLLISENTDQNTLSFPVIAACALIFTGIYFSPIGACVRNYRFRLFNGTEEIATPSTVSTELSESSISP